MTAVAATPGLSLAQLAGPPFMSSQPPRSSPGGETSRPTPAVVNDVALGDRRGAALPLARADAARVSSLMDELSAHNAFVQNFQRTAWDVYEAKFGKEKLEIARGGRLQSLMQFEARLQGQFADAGISLRRVPIGPGPDAPVALTVGEFAVGGGTSRYEVRTGTDGRMAGTIDGKVWNTWQVLPTTTGIQTPPGSLPTLQALSEQASTYRRDGSATLSVAAVLLYQVR